MKFSRKVVIPNLPSLGYLYKDAHKNPSDIAWVQSSFAVSAMAFRQSGRPFFNVWPTVAEALLKSNLEIDPALIPKSIIHELLTIEIRFCDSSKTEPFLLNVTNVRDWKTSENAETITGQGIWVSRAKIESDNSLSTSGVGMPFGVVAKSSDYWHSQNELRIAVGVMLLACDERYCEPILLNRDKNRKLTGGDLQRAINRARRNGQFGFNIGEHIEVSPHYRRPHFAIRWTGEGRKVPKIVPVKGSMINKDMLKEIPTGYEG